MCSGVSKSGSPRLRSIISTPFSLSSLPNRAILKVSGSLNRSNKLDNCIFEKIKIKTKIGIRYVINRDYVNLNILKIYIHLIVYTHYKMKIFCTKNHMKGIKKDWYE